MISVHGQLLLNHTPGVRVCCGTPAPGEPFEIVITEQPTEVIVGENFTVIVEMRDIEGNVVTDWTRVIRLTSDSAPDGATEIDQVVNAVAGVATFTVSADTAGSWLLVARLALLIAIPGNAAHAEEITANTISGFFEAKTIGSQERWSEDGTEWTGIGSKTIGAERWGEDGTGVWE